MLEVVVNRLSHMEDRIPLMVSERLVDVKESYRGKIIGSTRTVPVLIISINPVFVGSLHLWGKKERRTKTELAYMLRWLSFVRYIG